MATLLKLAWFVWLSTPSTSPSNNGAALLYKVNQIQVLQRHDQFEGTDRLLYSYLMRGDTHRGLQYVRPDNSWLRGNPRADLSHLPTTYHHRRSPVGVVMEKFNWFHGPDNRYAADARMPVSVVGIGPDPMSQLLNLWSEPPYGVIGMYVGGMAAYAHPFQGVDFYESDPNIIALSVPTKRPGPYFTYIQDARDRGALVRIFQGDERPTLKRRGPAGYYHVLVVEMCTRDRLEDVATDLLTKEGMAQCFGSLAEEGILCIHVSNRYLTMTPVVADVARSLGLTPLHGQDWANPFPRRPGVFSSEWVMVARRPAYLAGLRAPAGHDEAKQGPFWQVPVTTGQRVWTDAGRHSIRGLLKSDPTVSRMTWRLGDMLRQPGGYLLRIGARRAALWVFGFSSALSSGPFHALDQLAIRLREAAGQSVESLGHRPPLSVR